MYPLSENKQLNIINFTQLFYDPVSKNNVLSFSSTKHTPVTKQKKKTLHPQTSD